MNNSQHKESASPWRFPVFLRIIQTLGYIGIALIGGYLIGRSLAEIVNPADHQYLASALGISAVFAFLEKFIKQAPLLLRWIRTGDGDGLSTFVSFVFLTIVTFITAIWSGPIGSTPSKPNLPEQPIAASNPVFFVNVAANDPSLKTDREAVFMIPFFNEAGGCSSSNAAFKKGDTLDDTTKLYIRQLAMGLAQCARPDKPVRLDVRGFASSKQFDEKCGVNGQPLSMRESQHLNMEIANARAQAVRDEFVKAIESVQSTTHSSSSGQVFVEPNLWPSFDDMNASRRWNDENAGRYSHERAILTRRAELRVIDAGDCEVVAPQNSKPFTAETIDAPSSSPSDDVDLDDRQEGGKA